jgi:hypothetical protein
MSGSPLEGFRVEDGVYRLGQYTPVSLRDQVVRASYLVDALAHERIIGSDTRLLILGAGLAGVATALAALQRGVQDIVLVERAAVPLSLQAKCRSRWVDPTQYDWPATHWQDEHWPVKEVGPARTFTAVSSPFDPIVAAYATHWSTDFTTRIQALNNKVRFRNRAKALRWRRNAAGGLVVPLRDEHGAVLQPVETDILIVAMGYGKERAHLPDGANADQRFVGIDFWSDDKFQHEDFGVQNALPDHFVVVSGGGDGALQDFIRLATGLRAASTVLEKALLRSDHNDPWRIKLSDAWHWEEQATRALAYAPSPITKCEIERRLHQRYLEVVREFARSAQWEMFASWMDQKTSARRRGTLKLLLKCDHFSGCYALNHMAALLVLEYLERRDTPALLSKTAIISTTATHSGRCPIGCWGQAHELKLAHGTSCAHDEKALKDWDPASTDRMDAQGIVVRHGIRPLRLPGFPRQYLANQPVPAHLP